MDFCIPDKNASDLGGLDIFKEWLQLRQTAFSTDAINYGLPYPKGVLLVGVQGTGKSIAAKNNSKRVGITTLAFRLWAFICIACRTIRIKSSQNDTDSRSFISVYSMGG